MQHHLTTTTSSNESDIKKQPINTNDLESVKGIKGRLNRLLSACVGDGHGDRDEGQAGSQEEGDACCYCSSTQAMAPMDPTMNPCLISSALFIGFVNFNMVVLGRRKLALFKMDLLYPPLLILIFYLWFVDFKMVLFDLSRSVCIG